MNIQKNNKQAQLLEEIQERGFNVVTCGHCGSPFIHKTDTEEDIECPECETTQEQCDAPDLFYRREE